MSPGRTASLKCAGINAYSMPMDFGKLSGLVMLLATATFGDIT